MKDFFLFFLTARRYRLKCSLNARPLSLIFNSPILSIVEIDCPLVRQTEDKCGLVFPLLSDVRFKERNF